MICRKIRQCNIDFMPDSRHNRDAGGRDRACDDFLIETPEIFQGPSATANNDHLGSTLFVQQCQRIGNLSPRSLPLHLHRRNDDMERRPPSLEHAQDISNRRPGQRGNHADGSRKRRQDFFPALIKQPLCPEPLFQLVKRQLKRPDPLRFHRIEHDLVFAPRLVDRQTPAHDYLHALLQCKPHP